MLSERERRQLREAIEPHLNILADRNQVDRLLDSFTKPAVVYPTVDDRHLYGIDLEGTS